MNKKIAICYIVQKNDLPFLNLSLKAIDNIIKKKTQHEIKVFVCRDIFSQIIFPSELKHVKCELISSMFGYGAFNHLVGIFNTFSIIKKQFDYDYIVYLTPNTVLNSIDNIIATDIRMKKLSLFQNTTYLETLADNCKIFTKLGVEKINVILSNIKNKNNQSIVSLKKRIDTRALWYKCIRFLFSLCDLQNYKLYDIQGFKSNVEVSSNDKKTTWYSHQTVQFNNEVEMEKYVNTKRRKTNHLHDYLKGKTVALVGNATPQEDYSKEIDESDIVIRFNNFYNYNSNKVGKKVDCLILNMIAATKEDADIIFNDEVIQQHKPNLFLLSQADNHAVYETHKRYKGCKAKMLGNEAEDVRFTTGTILLKMLSEMKDVKCKFYAFDTDENWKKYLTNDAFGHLSILTEQENLRLQSMKQIIENYEH